MLRSKKIPKISLEKLYQVKPFHDIRIFFRRLKRLYHWCKLLWTNWDFDALTIFPLIEYKLKRVEYAIKHHPAVYDRNEYKSIRIAIKLANRLANDYHENKYYEWHEKKWGELIVTWKDIPGSTNKEYCSTRSNIKDIFDKELERKDHLHLMDNYYKWYTRDKKLLFNILEKYIELWWA